MPSKQEYNPEPILKTLSKRDEWTESVDACSLCPMPEWCDDRLLHELVFSMLLWESTMDNAVRAMQKIHEQFVDYNELRVAFPSEIESLLGARYQRGEDRSQRLHTALSMIFEKNQCLTLKPLLEMNKRDAREFLESLDALPRFVISRILLLGLDAHALPLDAKIARALHKAKLIQSAKNPDTIAVSMERVIRANQTLETYTRLERWLIAFENGS